MACAVVEELAVGVVVGDSRVVLVVALVAEVLVELPELETDDEPEEVEDVELPVLLFLSVVVAEVPEVVPEVRLTLDSDERTEAVLVWCGWAARAENKPTPAREPAATAPVTVRLRRRRRSRRERDVMPPLTDRYPRAR